MKKILILLLLLCSCGTKIKPRVSSLPESDIKKLKDKANFYLSQAKLDDANWIKDTECDGLLFNSLYSLGGGRADPTLAEGSKGVWFRSHRKDCYPNNSRSSISRDMFTGLFLWIYVHKRRDLIENIIQYGESHDWTMGQGDIFATNLRIEGRSMAYKIRYNLGGHDHPLRQVPPIRFEVYGYEDHLQMLSIFLHSLINGGMSKNDLKAAKDSAKREPRNALFQAIYHRYADGDFTEAIKILLDESLFPSSSLPSSSNRCEFYLWQRSERNVDWLPCHDEGKIFSGVDFLFAKAIILNEIN